MRFCGLSHWQWSLWQYDRRMAYQRTFPPALRAVSEPYFINHTSFETRQRLLQNAQGVDTDPE